MSKIGYARVSTIDQNEARQINALKELGCEKIFIDKQQLKYFINHKKRLQKKNAVVLRQLILE